MNRTEIQKRFFEIEKKQEKWELEEKKLQDLCTHPVATENHRSNTGNYDPSADSYWIEYKCPDCDKFWIKEQ